MGGDVQYDAFPILNAEVAVVWLLDYVCLDTAAGVVVPAAPFPATVRAMGDRRWAVAIVDNGLFGYTG